MSRSLPPTITVCSGGGQRTFAAGVDVVIGRDVRADVRLVEPVVSRAHVVLRYRQDRWVAIDNDSMNGMFVGRQRVRSVDIGNGEAIHIGNPAGPRLTFQLGVDNRSPDPRPAVPAVAQPGVPAVARPRSAPPMRVRQESARRTDVTRRTDVIGMAAATVRRALRPGAAVPAPAGSISIGRALDNDIVLSDVLASRHHARLVPTGQGMQIQDAGTINGTFVNGRRVKDAVLADEDVVTIGNVDFVFTNATLVRRDQPATTTGGLAVRDVSATLGRAVTLLDRVSFTARPGTLTAVIGPSGAGKSTLANVIVGATAPSAGAVSFEGHDVHGEYALLRSRIGMVPQDDVVHPQLSINQALGFAAQLRMPPDTSTADREQVINQVLAELELTPHAQTRVDKLSGGQRKRVSVAMELLTGPSLLVLDEPTTGLDPALDRQVMTMLRQLADAGRVVVVVTHSLTFIDVCDQVLLLAPGGKTAFCGAPADVAPAMGATDWADIFDALCADPVGAHQRYLHRTNPPGAAPARGVPEPPADLGKPAHTSLWRQFATVARRQVALLLADRGYFLFLALLPLIVGLLPLTVAGHAGFGRPPANSAAPFEPKQILSLLDFGAILMGTALTVRELVRERAIFRREQAVGLSTSAYLLAKVAVFGAAAVIQSGILVLIVTAPVIGKHPPAGAVVLGNPTLELFVGVAATCVVAAILGLCVSAFAHTSNQVMPVLAMTLTAQLVLAGGLIPVTDRPLFDPVSWFTPARWGLAATASTADLSNLVVAPRDSHWKHTPSAWLVDIAMLGVLALCYAGFVRWKIRLNRAANLKR